jgi:NAD(P)-dependent dehydrogenase (short-subunit alcohol dehydrogenase family)
MSQFAGRVAVVTGAGSGIGRALAVELAGRGAKLALADVNTSGLAETARLVESLGAQVRTDHLDVSEKESVLDYAETVATHFGKVNQVYNNAGVAYHGSFERCELKDFERVVDIDFWGVVYGTRAFLPHLIASGDGHLVNTSSLFGLLSVPGQTAYCAAKFGVRGFTESLRQELIVEKRPVKVTCVHPGGIKTGIARNAVVGAGEDLRKVAAIFDEKLAKTLPETAAKSIAQGVAKNRPRVVIGPDARALDAFVRATGPAYQRVVSTFFPMLMR